MSDESPATDQADTGPSPLSPPDASTPDVDTRRLAESKEYGRRKVYCHLLDMASDLAFLVVATVWVASPMDEWLQTFPLLDLAWLRLAAFFLLLAIVQYVVGFPLAFYSGFRLEHKYGLSRQSRLRWLRRSLLRALLVIAFGLLMIEGLFWLIWLTGPYWWFAAAAGMFLVSIVLGQLLPVLILPLFYKIERLDEDELSDRFAGLTAGTSLKIEGVYRMQLSIETVKANAMLAGLGRTRRVILGDTLMDNFTPDEIEIVFAHEVGHHVHRHIPKLIVGGLLFSLVSFFLCDRVLIAWMGAGFTYAALPVAALPLLMLVVTLFSLITSPLQNAVSRHFERQSDRYALDRTGLRAAYTSAFSRLAELNKADPDPHWLEVFFFHDHPPIAERLAMAETDPGKES